MTTKRVLIITAIFILLFIVRETDWFQEEFYPIEYWSKRVILLENAVSIDEAMLRDAAMELKKLQMIANLRVAQEINSGVFFGLPKDEARKLSVETIRQESRDLSDDIVLWNKRLKDDRNELEMARIQLSRYEQGRRAK